MTSAAIDANDTQIFNRPSKLSNINRIVYMFPFDSRHLPIDDDMLSVFEINRGYSISDIINSISFPEIEKRQNVSLLELSRETYVTDDIRIFGMLNEVSACTSRKYVKQERIRMASLSDADLTSDSMNANQNISLLYKSNIDLEFIAVYIESLKLRNIKFSDTIQIGRRKSISLKHIFDEAGIDIGRFNYSQGELLILPELDMSKSFYRYEDYDRFSAKHTASMDIIHHAVSKFGRGLNYTGRAISYVGDGLSAVGDKIESNITINNITQRSLVSLNVAKQMELTTGDSLISYTKSDAALPSSSSEAGSLLSTKMKKTLCSLACVSLVVGAYFGNISFHNMTINDNTSVVIKTLHTVNEKVYHFLPGIDSTVEISSDGVKGILKPVSRANEPVQKAHVWSDSELQLQRDFYQAFSLYDSNNPQSIKSLSELVDKVKIIVKAQQVLGVDDILINKDIFDKASLKIEDLSKHTLSNDISAAL